MKLSDKTKQILKNFSQINNSIYIRGGNTLSTISATRNIYSKATVDETFPIPFAIYDLAQFLNGITLFGDSEIEFDDASYLTIKSGRSRVKYFFADPDVITSPPEKEIEIPSYEFKFSLSSTILDSLIKSASIYALPDLCLESVNGEVILVTKDKDNETSNTVSFRVGEFDVPFSFNFKTESIKIIPGNYMVEVTSRVAHFVSEDSNLEYFIALEPDSTYGD
jgi:hypothetical protein